MTGENSKAIELEQEKIYDNIHTADLTNPEIITHFVESETIAQKYQFQGKFYSGAYFKIKKIVKTTMKDIPEEMRVKAFFFLILFDDFFPIHKKNHSCFLEAVQRTLPIIAEDNYINRNIKFNIYLLFGISEEEIKAGSMEKNSYEEFESIWKFIDKAKSYSAYPYMRNKKEKFAPFLDNEILMSRIRSGFSRYEIFNFVKAASFILLLMDKEKESKNILFEMHTKDLSPDKVWLLGSFYKDFQDTDEQIHLLEDLYSRYPKEWIDEYQEST
jgi:hypothetical protein